jgi:hypothetical protein
MPVYKWHLRRFPFLIFRRGNCSLAIRRKCLIIKGLRSKAMFPIALPMGKHGKRDLSQGDNQASPALDFFHDHVVKERRGAQDEPRPVGGPVLRGS